MFSFNPASSWNKRWRSCAFAFRSCFLKLNYTIDKREDTALPYQASKQASNINNQQQTFYYCYFFFAHIIFCFVLFLTLGERCTFGSRVCNYEYVYLFFSLVIIVSIQYMITNTNVAIFYIYTRHYDYYYIWIHKLTHSHIHTIHIFAMWAPMQLIFYF